MPDTTTSPCSASYAGCKRDTARMCCTAALLMQSAGSAAVDQCLCPPKQQDAVGGRANDGTDRQTDRRTSVTWTLLHILLTHTHPFNGPLSGTTRVSRYQKGKTNLDFTEARDSEWQWHQLGHMQTICTSLQSDHHTNNSSSNFCRPGAFLPPSQRCQSTE